MPFDPTGVISSMKFKTDDKEIEGKVLNKQEAQERYDDGMASGKLVALAQEDKEA